MENQSNSIIDSFLGDDEIIEKLDTLKIQHEYSIKSLNEINYKKNSLLLLSNFAAILAIFFFLAIILKPFNSIIMPEFKDYLLSLSIIFGFIAYKLSCQIHLIYGPIRALKKFKRTQHKALTDTTTHKDNGYS
jgi:hypothetical protein